MSKCKTCQAEIKWIKTEKNKTVPVNLQSIYIVPNLEGKTIAVCCNGKVIKGDLAMKGTANAVEGYTSHFATCPQADQHRRRRIV